MSNSILIIGIGGAILSMGILGRFNLRNLTLGLENKALRMITIVTGTVLIALPFLDTPGDDLSTRISPDIIMSKDSEIARLQNEVLSANQEKDIANSIISKLQSKIDKLSEQPPPAASREKAPEAASPSDETLEFKKKLMVALATIKTLEKQLADYDSLALKSKEQDAAIVQLQDQLTSKNQEITALEDNLTNLTKEKTVRIVPQTIKTGMDLRNANLSGTNLSGTDLSEADLTEANLSMASLNDAVLWRAKLDHADIERTSLRDANLFSADLRRAKLNGANLRGAVLEKAVLDGANLWRAKLYGSDLNDSSLKDANLQGADFRTALLHEADLTGADLRQAKNLTIEQLRMTKSLYKTKIDPELMAQIEKKYSFLLEAPK